VTIPNRRNWKGRERRTQSEVRALKALVLELAAQRPALPYKEIAYRMGCTPGYISLMVREARRESDRQALSPPGEPADPRVPVVRLVRGRCY